MAIFKGGAGPGGNMGKGTKPMGSWGAQGAPPSKKPGVTHNRGTASKQASQTPMGMKPAGGRGGSKQASAKATKPGGKYGSRGAAGKRQATGITKPMRAYYNDKSGPASPVPAGQSMGRNTIPNGRKP